MKKIYLVRHCSAIGQEPEAELTEVGIEQAKMLVDFFSDKNIDRVVSSPFKRALQTIEPFCEQEGKTIQVENNLRERVLSTQDMPDWFERLRDTYDDRDLKFAGGESNNEAAIRVMAVLESLIMDEGVNHAVVVTHGGALSLILNHFDESFGFEQWQKLSNPDVFVLEIQKESPTIRRVWS
ncbi:phosphoglycerate mutase [Alkalihalobacillus alcalophilus ATCC 27647 = CGMCC 1.3604]|uniref:Phosphoglycerate mutase n=1 Tax=Alkalihalobacillus alcalophilus ATCC 27647 = CGMCC 1.3604 TaxID=1218173 RepID=A0A094WNE3_ALKAL|nr:histidine phosphatase family protein [Alkalihalobacillus alcalophilus]KGA98356.1 phosphoglycerate mutase [Alkalihalobacillus alcalophilus ATCC 27647 = CGMCC 1.3604]MED1563656.1 histidine phosphatase family protein [Alkalihalobacillus alcalophilus]THG91613.1 phosphoglycerate mutase [Alkalihalobacillus alcalophilus ATCC 27647 = CGMCC 1.3604]